MSAVLRCRIRRALLLRLLAVVLGAALSACAGAQKASCPVVFTGSASPQQAAHARLVFAGALDRQQERSGEPGAYTTGSRHKVLVVEMTHCSEQSLQRLLAPALVRDLSCLGFVRVVCEDDLFHAWQDLPAP